jgi:hypothetical protein
MDLSLLKTLFFTKTSRGWGSPLLFWGPPGVGKTGILESFAQCLTINGEPMHVETLSPGEAGEGAFGVVPVPLDKGGVSYITYPEPWWIQNFKGDESDGGPGGRGMVFLDELSSAPPALHPPLLGLIHAGRIGGAKLPGRTRIIGAANPPELAAAGFDLAPPVANRLGHMEWAPPSVGQWTDYMLAQGGGASSNMVTIDIVAEEQRVDAAWAGAYAKAAGLVTAFLRSRAQHLHAMPKAGAAYLDAMRWPSHRSWSNATNAFASSIVQGTASMYRDRLIAAYVGQGISEEFANWTATADLPDPDEVMDGKITFKHEPHRLDRTLALSSSMAASLLGDDNAGRRQVRSDAFWRFIGQMADQSATDLVIPGVGAILRAETAKPELRLSTTREGNAAISKIAPHMKAAGRI